MLDKISPVGVRCNRSRIRYDEKEVLAAGQRYVHSSYITQKSNTLTTSGANA